MRTTLTLEPDVALKLKRRMAERKLTLKDAVNQALRAALQAPEANPKAPFKVEPFPFKFKPGVDPSKLNQLLDELDIEEFVRKAR